MRKLIISLISVITNEDTNFIECKHKDRLQIFNQICSPNVNLNNTIFIKSTCMV